MTCDELRDYYDLFALGLAEGPERSELLEHLGRGCPNCLPGVRAAMAIPTALSGTATLVDPPARLRRRILAMVKPEEERRAGSFGFGWTPVFAALSIVLCAGLVLLFLQLGRVSRLRSQEMARLSRAMEVITAPDSREVRFGPGVNQPPRGRVVINPRRGVVLLAANLPKLESGKTFELWLIPQGKGAKPIPAGLFQAGSDRTALAIDETQLTTTPAAVAVTIEDEQGAPAPTTKPILVAPTS